MKKLLTLILVVALILPAAALVEDRDPVVGCWYMYFDGELFPEYKGAFGDCDSWLTFLYFAEDGMIRELNNRIIDGNATPTYSIAGKWEKKDGEYYISILGLGTGIFHLNSDTLEFPLIVQRDYYQVMHRVIPFNPHTDIIY